MEEFGEESLDEGDQALPQRESEKNKIVDSDDSSIGELEASDSDVHEMSQISSDDDDNETQAS